MKRILLHLLLAAAAFAPAAAAAHEPQTETEVRNVILMIGKILYRKDVTVCPCCGGAMSYEVCTGWEHQRSSA